jgi:ABC-type multidrug transport system ATPase subunit
VNGSASLAVRVENLTVRERGSVVLADVALSVPRGSIYGLIGLGDGPATLMRCLTGAYRTGTGRVTILGYDAGSRWRLRSRRLFVPAGRDLSSTLGNRRPPDLLLLEAPEEKDTSGLAAQLRSFASRGTATLFTTRQASLAEAAADRIGILARGRLVVDETGPELRARFRRIRYANSVTETRTEFGNELDAFDALRVQVRGWGIDAIVSNFEDSAFERFRRMDGVENAEAEPLSLEEIFAAVAGEK